MAQNNSSKSDYSIDTDNCLVCRELLSHLQLFFDLLNKANNVKNNWLTAEQVAEELKISKSIIYRLIRNGDLEAVNIVENNSKISQKGHYRIERRCLNNYLQNKKVYPLPNKLIKQIRRFPVVKDYLGL